MSAANVDAANSADNGADNGVPQTYSATTFQRVNVTASSVTVSGDVTLTGDNGLVRVVAETADGTQWLIAEATSLLHDAGVTWDRECQETCQWPSARQIVSLAVIVENAHFTGTWAASPTAARRLRAPRDTVSALNAALTRKGYLWRAADTPISQLSYQAKRALLGVPAHLPLPDLHGLEYYRGGIFSDRPPSATTRDIRRARSLLPASLDYRDWQGADWTTPVRHQLECGSCVAFGMVSAIETTVNLYLNQHLNLDLAEQELVSCSGKMTCHGTYMGALNEYLTSPGIRNESCFTYRGIDALGQKYMTAGFAPVLCTDACATPTYRVTVPTWIDSSFYLRTEGIKNLLWRYGAITYARELDYGYVGHAMAIVGYGTVQAGETILSSNLSHFVTVPIDSPLIGETYWIVKNSWGDDWGEDGFVRDVHDVSSYDAATAIAITPALPIACTDNDHDGYFFWGISATKPLNCPQNSQAARDCDDSDETQGAVTPSFQCTPTTPNTLTVQIVNDYGDGGTVTPGTVSLHEFVPITQTVTARPNYRIREILKNGVAQPLTASHTFTYQADPTTQTLRVTFTPTFPFCVDADFDGFAVWGGAATKPPYCPSHTALAEDCDDTTPRKGAWVNGVCSDQTQDYRIMIGASDHGTVTPSGDVWRSSGDSLTIQMTPRPGYRVTGLIVDGVSTAAAPTYTFTNITTTHTFYATFGKD